MNNGHLKIYEVVLPAIVRDKPFSSNMLGIMLISSHIYTNKISEYVNPSGWGNPVRDMGGMKSQWATLGNGNCVCLNDGLTEFAKLHPEESPAIFQDLPFLGYFADVNEISKRMETTAAQIAEALHILTEDFQTLEDLIKSNQEQS